MITLLLAIALHPTVCAPPPPGVVKPCDDRGDLSALAALYQWPDRRWATVGWPK